MYEYQQDLQEIERMVHEYFLGLHHADVNRLSKLFEKEVVLRAPGLRRSRDEWLELVASRPVPHEKGDEFKYKILSVECLGEQAMVKVECPLLGNDFIDFLGLLKEEGKWMIVSKMYCGY